LTRVLWKEWKKEKYGRRPVQTVKPRGRRCGFLYQKEESQKPARSAKIRPALGA
jgi:hypothetical protein